MSPDPNDVTTLAAAVNSAVPRSELKAWPGGWPGEVEAALMDAVLSIRANYGQPHNGVRGAVGKWREERGGSRLDDLDALATFDSQRLAVVIENGQRLSGGSLKADAIVEAAQNLVGVGVRHATDLSEPSSRHKRAYVSVKGLGPVTWEYFLMLLGVPGVKADTWIVRFVEQALDRQVSPVDARALLMAVAHSMKVSPSALDHNIWDYMRRRPRKQAG